MADIEVPVIKDDPTLDNIAEEFWQSLQVSSKRTNATTSDNFNIEGVKIFVTAAVEVFGETPVTSWETIARDCGSANDKDGSESGVTAGGSSLYPAFTKIWIKMNKILNDLKSDESSTDNPLKNAKFPSKSWFRGTRGITSWLVKGKKMGGEKKSSKELGNAAHDFQCLFCGFILQLYYAKAGVTSPETIEQHVGNLVYSKGCQAALGNRFPFFKFKIVIPYPTCNMFPFAIRDDDIEKRCPLRLEGYSAAGDAGGNRQRLNNTVLATIEGLKPGDNLEKQKIVVDDNLELKRQELDLAEANVEKLKEEIVELESTVIRLDKEIQTEHLNRRVVDQLRMSLPFNENEILSSLSEKVCEVVKKLSEKYILIENPDEKRQLFLKDLNGLTFGNLVPQPGYHTNDLQTQDTDGGDSFRDCESGSENANMGVTLAKESINNPALSEQQIIEAKRGSLVSQTMAVSESAATTGDNIETQKINSPALPVQPTTEQQVGTLAPKSTAGFGGTGNANLDKNKNPVLPEQPKDEKKKTTLTAQTSAGSGGSGNSKLVSKEKIKNTVLAEQPKVDKKKTPMTTASPYKPLTRGAAQSTKTTAAPRSMQKRKGAAAKGDDSEDPKKKKMKETKLLDVLASSQPAGYECNDDEEDDEDDGLNYSDDDSEEST